MNREIRLKKTPAEKSDSPGIVFTLGAPNRLTLEGTTIDMAGKESKFRATLSRFDERSFLVLNRGFHRINEAPFNR